MFKKIIVLMSSLLFLGATTLNGVKFTLKIIESSLEKFEQQVKIIQKNIHTGSLRETELHNTFRVLNLLQQKELPRLKRRIERGLSFYSNQEYHPKKKRFSQYLQKTMQLKNNLKLIFISIESNADLANSYNDYEKSQSKIRMIKKVFWISLALHIISICLLVYNLIRILCELSPIPLYSFISYICTISSLILDINLLIILPYFIIKKLINKTNNKKIRKEFLC
jgi:hypothetical protein